jgi:hypothetical protein
MGRKGPINCQSHFTIPAGTKPGVYALYWVWDFTKLTAVDPSYVEMYTSCMDVEVVASDESAPPPPVSTSPKGGRKTTTTSSCDPTQDPKPVIHTKTTTRTRHHTKTVTGHPKGTTGRPSRKPFTSNKAVNVVYTTIYTEKFVTVTRTA